MTKRELTKLWKLFNEKAENYGYEIWVHNDVHMGDGTIAFKDDDFAPIIRLHVTFEYKKGKNIIIPAEMCIFVEDRNGNRILDGVTCAIYHISNKNGIDFKEEFVKMCDYALKKWSVYSRSNRLDFRFNNMKEERIIWDKK